MKKMLLTAMAVGLMSVSAFAVDGKVTKILIQATNNIVVTITDGSQVERTQKLVGTADAIQTMTAAVLTARSANMDVTLTQGTAENGNGWNNVTLR